MNDVPTMDRYAIMAWRKAERERLIAARLALPAEARGAASARIAALLEEAIGLRPGLKASFYWPFRGEPDLRPLIARLVEAGGTALLPVVIAKGQPLVFRPWAPGAPLVKGVWNIPVPDTEETAIPDVTIAPLVGFDGANYRLGYGGGFFDRTLATLSPRPRVIGIGYGLQRIPTIHPLPHDIPMDEIVVV
ncbi:5-formyltetrahydrofolate cyclo-ligase [Gellertiella hungarica]|uniref:5-formyltetrahydrofolate cyclo-ligase n=1 Tax=Gellertiella hungarica TaxID=1572859 RepID=A0A7W6J1P1_9HYPH|nr:5-formyltetrahydrofolate cyclo-ligase [Gellertiella hungarica]MBB4063150.1 5,10-methenyltetrahydrofolate synthetase [Gellertiella hungarica]